MQKKKDSSVGKRTLLSKKGHFCPVDFWFLKLGLKRTLVSTQGSADFRILPLDDLRLEKKNIPWGLFWKTPVPYAIPSPFLIT